MSFLYYNVWIYDVWFGIFNGSRVGFVLWVLELVKRIEVDCFVCFWVFLKVEFVIKI